MKEYPFLCPNCGAHLTFDAELPEHPVKCEYCDSCVYLPQEILEQLRREREEAKQAERQRREREEEKIREARFQQEREAEVRRRETERRKEEEAAKQRELEQWRKENETRAANKKDFFDILGEIFVVIFKFIFGGILLAAVHALAPFLTVAAVILVIIIVIWILFEWI